MPEPQQSRGLRDEPRPPRRELIVRLKRPDAPDPRSQAFWETVALARADGPAPPEDPAG